MALTIKPTLFKNTRNLLSLSVAVLAIVSVTPAFGQTGPIAEAAASVAEDNVEIVVTAQKRSERLVEVPIAISVLGGEDIRERGVTDFVELSNQVPGLVLRESVAGRSTQAIVIRGVGADDFRPNGNPTAALHVDGVYQGSNIFFSNQLFDVAQIEVLKGPQGTLYGRNTSTGVVNVLTEKPGKTASGYVDVEYGRFGVVNVEGGVGGPISDTIGVRVSAIFEKGNGPFLHQGTAGLEGFRLDPRIPALPRTEPVENFGGPNFAAMRAIVDAQISPQTLLRLQIHGARDRSELNITDVPLESPSRNPIDNDPFTVASNIVPRLQADSFGGYVQLEHELGETVTFTAQLAHESVDQIAANSDGTPLRLTDVEYDTQLRQTTVEARLDNGTASRLDWILGGFYLTDNVKFDSVLLLLDNPTFATNLFTRYSQQREGWSVFGQGDLALTERLSATLGLRYSREIVNFEGITGDLNPFGTTRRSDSFPLLFLNSFEDGEVSGRGAITFRPTDESSFYIAAARGFKAGGFDGSTLFTPPENEPILSETVWSYEAGFKYLPRGGGIGLTGDVFYADYDGLQGNREVDFNGTPVLVRVNLAGARVFGGEFAATWRPEPRLNLSLGVAYLDSEITAVNGSAALQARLLGNRLPDAPKLSFNGSARFEQPIGSLLLTAQADFSRKSSMFKEEANLVAVPSYTLVNARLGIGERERGFRAALWARNLTDATYFTSYQPQGNRVRQRLAAPPRTFGIEVGFRF